MRFATLPVAGVEAVLRLRRIFIQEKVKVAKSKQINKTRKHHSV